MGTFDIVCEGVTFVASLIVGALVISMVFALFYSITAGIISLIHLLS